MRRTETSCITSTDVRRAVGGETTMFGEHMQDLLQHTTEPEVDEPSRELTVDEALEIAIQLHQDDRLEEANVVYREILAVDSANPRALHFSGVLAHQVGRS